MRIEFRDKKLALIRNYKKLTGEQDGQRQVRINDQYRIVFTLDETTIPPTVMILEIGDPH